MVFFRAFRTREPVQGAARGAATGYPPRALGPSREIARRSPLARERPGEDRLPGVAQLPGRPIVLIDPAFELS